MNNTKSHQELVNSLLLTFGSRPDVRLWKQVNGVFRDFHSHRMISVGIPGSTDIIGITAPYGRMLAIEVKTGEGKLSKRQRIFRDNMIRKFGGIYILARSVIQAVEDFEREKAEFEKNLLQHLQAIR